LSRLCHKEPPLDPRKVKAVLLYARANHLGPGYIYTHLAKDAAVDELYLRFALLAEATLSLFEQAVTEMKMGGGGLIPDTALAILPEHVDLFAQFAEIFAGVEAAPVAAAIRYHHSEAHSIAPDLFLPAVAPSAGSQNRAEQGDQSDRGDNNKLSGFLSPDSPKLVQREGIVEPRETEILWGQVLSQLQLQMTRGTFETWVKDTRLIAREGLKFTVAVSSEFAKDWLENRLRTTIQRTVMNFIKAEGDQTLPKVEIKFVVDGKFSEA
jgi:hypothetical protein